LVFLPAMYSIWFKIGAKPAV
ncbi:multidrug transporter, partial [Acinetobacter sp. V2]